MCEIDMFVKFNCISSFYEATVTIKAEGPLGLKILMTIEKKSEIRSLLMCLIIYSSLFKIPVQVSSLVI